MTDTSQSTTPLTPQAPARVAAPNVPVRMDKSRPFSTVHGERPPGDPHARIFFYQDGIPFNSEGLMLARLIDSTDEKLMALAERMQKRANAAAQKRGGEEGSGEGEKDADDDIVNLDAWLRGERRYLWPHVTNRIAAIYKKRVNSIRDAVEFLVEQRLVPAHEVGREFQKHLDAA